MESKLFKKNFVIGIIILFIGASVVPSIGGESISFYANQDIEISHGTLTNDYTYTQESDNQYEGITERESGGKPSSRYSYLEHKWTIDVAGGHNSYVFYLEAYHTVNNEGDDFVFAYSTNDISYNNMLIVSKTSDDDAYQTFEFPEALSGTIYIIVKDMDRTSGNRFLDTIYVDHMYIEATTAPDTTPPVISNVASTVHDSVWYNANPSFVGGTLVEREWHTMAYDSAADKTILFGGNDVIKNGINDTWIFDYTTNTWYNASPSIVGGKLHAGDGHAMVYDSAADKTILFGGDPVDPIGYLNDTWAYSYSNNTWYKRNPTIVGGTLYGRFFHAVAYDSSADRAILFGGGRGGAAPRLNDTWTYDYNSNTWYNMSPSIVGGTLYIRSMHGMAYDSAADRTILFGGATESPSYHTDTWVYDYNNNTWYNMSPTVVGGTMEGRGEFGMVYDSAADRTILFGGVTSNSELLHESIGGTWAYNYNENTWYNASPADDGTLLDRHGHSMVYDSVADRAILFGGVYKRRPETWIDLNDTWIFVADVINLTATITWTTDEPSDSVVSYGTTTALGSTESNSAMVISHSITLTDVLPDTTYYFEVQSTDAAGNTAIDDNNGLYYAFPDITAPVISDVSAIGITHLDATITWTTDENSNSVVNYGTTTALGSTTSNAAMVTSHSIILTDLLPDTTYYYEVQSTDSSGNTAIDNNNGSYYTFVTETAPTDIMHVYSIDMWYEPVKNKNIIYTQVKIVDSIDNPVENVMVYIQTEIPTGEVVFDNANTGADGTVTFVYGPTPKIGTYVSTVTNVVKDGWIYDSNANLETSESLTVP